MITIETITRLDYASLINKSKQELAMLVVWLIKRIESGPTPAASDGAGVLADDAEGDTCPAPEPHR